MWSEDIIKKKLEENQLPCARCHKWRLKEDFKKGMKTCNVCLEAWQIRQKELSEKRAELEASRKNECLIS